MNPGELKLSTPITIDELGRMVQRGFADMKETFEKTLNEKIDQKIDALEVRLGHRFDGLQNQIDNIYTNYPNRLEFNQLSDRVVRVEQKVGISKPRRSNRA